MQIIKNIKFLLILTLLSCGGSFAVAQDLAAISSQQADFALKAASPDILDEKDDMKALILKYSAASPKDKPAIKKEIEKLAAKDEADAQAKTEVRLKRQEEKIKELKQNLAERKKNKDKIVASKVEYLVSNESVEKLKNESLAKKMADTVKNKTSKQKTKEEPQEK
ncbi:MAG: hypothetical protein LBM71_04465 [Elusimicrobiota bacterium]|jgi:hypothetical protein|nr:hypothetical protein [Elusimicrobiota bacterium]